MSYKNLLSLTLVAFLFFACSDNTSNSDDGDDEPTNRSFNMGFTTWSYGPNLADVSNTYTFIQNNSDMYTEHIDNKIPWQAWINDTTLPSEFTNEITGKANRRIPGLDLLLSVSMFNSAREELAEDFDGTIPTYTEVSDSDIENAYFKHIQYLLQQFDPDYLVISIEANEFRLRAENKWAGYTSMIQNVKTRIRVDYPDLPISESVSLHNVFESTEPDAADYISEMITYMNQQDFAAISFYPFLKGLNSQNDFQRALDFLHSNLTVPIAFVETSHLAEDLIIPNLSVSIPGSEAEQNVYLETLINNAEDQDYMFICWWAHRDFDALWETFPVEVRDLGQIWRDTGLIDEDGNDRAAMLTWDSAFNPTN